MRAEVRHWAWLYGKRIWVRYRAIVRLAKFLLGHQAQAVWMQFEDENCNLSNQPPPS